MRRETEACQGTRVHKDLKEMRYIQYLCTTMEQDGEVQLTDKMYLSLYQGYGWPTWSKWPTGTPWTLSK